MNLLLFLFIYFYFLTSSRYAIPEIIEARVEPTEGRIQPLKMQTFLLTICTGSRPSRVTISVTCKFINMSERRLYEKNELLLLDKAIEFENEFVITEKGIQYPVISLKKILCLRSSSNLKY